MKHFIPLDAELIGDVIPVFIFGQHRVIEIFKMPSGYKATWDGGDRPPWKYPELTVPSRLEAFTQALAGMVDADAIRRMTPYRNTGRADAAGVRY